MTDTFPAVAASPALGLSSGPVASLARDMLHLRRSSAAVDYPASSPGAIASTSTSASNPSATVRAQGSARSPPRQKSRSPIPASASAETKSPRPSARSPQDEGDAASPAQEALIASLHAAIAAERARADEAEQRIAIASSSKLSGDIEMPMVVDGPVNGARSPHAYVHESDEESSFEAAAQAAFTALDEYEALCTSRAAAARTAFADALYTRSKRALREFTRSLPLLPPAMGSARQINGNGSESRSRYPPSNSNSNSSAPFSSMILPPPPSVRTTYREQAYNEASPVAPQKRRRVDDDWRAEERDYKYANGSTSSGYYPPPSSNSSHHRGNSGGYGHAGAGKYSQVQAEPQPVQHHATYPAQARDFRGDAYAQSPVYSGPPRVDARELMRGQKERARRGASGYDSYERERHYDALPAPSAGMKRRRSGSEVSFDDDEREITRNGRSFASNNSNDVDIDAMLLETATDGEREDGIPQQRGNRNRAGAAERSLPSPLSSASPPAAAPATLKSAATLPLAAPSSSAAPAKRSATTLPSSSTATTTAPISTDAPTEPAQYFPPTNAAGERICRQCGAAGRVKDGRCVEKWGPGPLGPGTVCDRCRKKMKRVEKRVGGAASASGAGAQSGSGSGVAYSYTPAANKRDQASSGLERGDTLLLDAAASLEREGSRSPYSAPTRPAAASRAAPAVSQRRAPTPPSISAFSSRDNSRSPPAAPSSSLYARANGATSMAQRHPNPHAHTRVSAARSTASSGSGEDVDAEADSDLGEDDDGKEDADGELEGDENEDNELEDELADAADSAVPAQRTPERRWGVKALLD